MKLSLLTVHISSIAWTITVATLSFLVFSTVHAEVPPTPAIDYAKINQLQVKQMAEEAKTNPPATSEKTKVMLDTKMQERIINLSSNVSTHLAKVISRLENIMNRLEARIVKLQASGTDVSKAALKLQDARSILTLAKEAHGKIGSVKDAVSSDTPREKFTLIRLQFMTVRDLLKQTHTLMKDTVVLLKSAPKRAALPEIPVTPTP